MRRPIILAALLLALASYPAAHNSSPAVRALFIGNSLTYENNLPAMIEAVAASAGLKGRVACRGVAMPDFGLAGTLGSGGRACGASERPMDARRPAAGALVAAGLAGDPPRIHEEVCVRGRRRRERKSSSTACGRHAIGSTSWTTWSSRTGSPPRTSAGSLVPVGEGWRAAWRQDPSLPLYAPDQFHPSPMGTYLAALMFFQHLTGKSVVGLPPPERPTRR